MTLVYFTLFFIIFYILIEPVYGLDGFVYYFEIVVVTFMAGLATWLLTFWIGTLS